MLAHLESIIRLKVVIFFICNSIFSIHTRNIKPAIENQTRLDMKQCNKIDWSIQPHLRMRFFSNRYFSNFSIYVVLFSLKFRFNSSIFSNFKLLVIFSVRIRLLLRSLKFQVKRRQSIHRNDFLFQNKIN